MEISSKIEYMSEIIIGNEKYPIHLEKSQNLNELNFDKIIENISKLRSQSDMFLQKVIDDNKFLIAFKNKKTNDENFEEEN